MEYGSGGYVHMETLAYVRGGGGDRGERKGEVAREGLGREIEEGEVGIEVGRKKSGRERLARERLGRERLGRERLGRERLGRERLGRVEDKEGKQHGNKHVHTEEQHLGRPWAAGMYVRTTNHFVRMS